MLKIYGGLAQLYWLDESKNGAPPPGHLPTPSPPGMSGVGFSFRFTDDGVRRPVARCFVELHPGFRVHWQWSGFWIIRAWIPKVHRENKWPVCYINFPLILPVATFGLASAYWLLPFHRRRRRRERGLCVRCGYDLTKNESGRCPECGVVIASAKQVSA